MIGSRVQRITTTSCLMALAFATPGLSQEKPRIPINIDVSAMYAAAFGGTGGGFQVTVSTALPISVLGARYSIGGQFWYSQPQIVGGSLGSRQRQMSGIGGHLTASWDVAGRFFPYLRVPVQAVRSVVPEANLVRSSGVSAIPEENLPGEMTSFAFGVGGGGSLMLGRAVQIFGGVNTITHRLYETNRTPILSFELGISLAPGAIGRR